MTSAAGTGTMEINIVVIRRNWPNMEESREVASGCRDKSSEGLAGV